MVEKKFPLIYRPLFKNRIFIKYISAGFVAAMVDLASLYIFVEYIFYHRYLIAATSAFIFAFVFGAILQKFWTFQDKDTSGMGFQFILYIILAVVNLALNLLLIFIFIEVFDLWYLLAQLIAMAILASMNFVLYSRFVFKKSLMVPGSVLLAAGIFPPDIGGPATHTLRFLKRFSDKGLKVGVVTYSDVKESGEIDNGFDVERVSRKILTGLRHIVYLIKIFAASLRYEIIYAQDISATGLPAAFVARLVGRRFMVRIGGDLLWERLAEKGKTKLSVINFYNEDNYKKRFLYHVGQTVMMNAEKIIVPSEILANIYINHYGIDQNKIFIVPNPLPNISKIKGRKELRDIIFAGRFTKYKNLERLIIAFANICNDLDSARLIMAGDGPEKRNIIELVKRLKIEDRVFFPGVISADNLMVKISSSAICVLPSLTDINPNFILECISMGKPIMVTRENGLSLKLPDKFLVDPIDIGDIEEKLKNIFLFRENFAEEIHKIVEDAHTLSWDDIINKHLELFKNK